MKKFSEFISPIEEKKVIDKDVNSIEEKPISIKEQLPKKEYTVIIYFAPDCGHCQHEMKEIIKSIDKFNKVNFVWVSFKSMPEISEFYLKYEISKYPNMFMGRDLDYKLPSFYRVKFTPFVAVYDKNNLFIKAFEGGAEMKDLLAVLKLN